MKKNYFTLLLMLMSVSLFAQQNRRIGVNLPTMSYGGQVFMMADLKQQSSRWFIQDASQTDWDIDSVGTTPVVMPVLANGYPEKVPFIVDGTELYPHCILITEQPAPYFYPSGNYTIIIEGTGTIELEWDASASFTGPGKFTLPVTASEAGLHLRITASDSLNPITNIDVLFPDHAVNYPGQIFNQTFLEIIQPFEVLRFMKATTTEENPIVSWSDRTATDDHTFYTDAEAGDGFIRPGIPWEYVIRLCNETEKDPWICIPFMADDNYITQLATLFNDSLDPARKVYLEYSNETWNGSYWLTANYVNNQGLTLGLDTNAFTAGLKFHTMRSIQMFDIFESVFGASSATRVEKVLASGPWDYPPQVMVASLSDNTINPNSTLPDALSMAPYIGGDILMNMDSAQICNATPEDMIDSLLLMDRWMEEAVPWYKYYADSLGIKTYAYEGGQHMAAPNFGAADSCSTSILSATSRHTDMQTVYCEYYDYWYDTLACDLHVTFVLAEMYGEFGAFGLLESQWQDTETSPKWKAHNSCVFENGSVGIDDHYVNYTNSEVIVYPNPSDGIFFIKEEQAYDTQIWIYNSDGRLIFKGRYQGKIDISSEPAGLYYVKAITESKKVNWYKFIKQ